MTDPTSDPTRGDVPLYTAIAHNRTGPDGTSWTDRGLRLAVRSPLSPAAAEAATDPEELLALAWATCLSGSARIVAPGREVTVRVEVDLVEDPAGTGFAFAPTAFVSFSGTTPEQADALAAKAHARCPISKLLAGRGTATVIAESDTSH
jgi:organic hydroperoxide reductase OsmC/OhrA